METDVGHGRCARCSSQLNLLQHEILSRTLQKFRSIEIFAVGPRPEPNRGPHAPKMGSRAFDLLGLKYF